MPRQEITIQGQVFTYEAPYSEGSTLKANEASALNGLLGENLRNNFASKVKKAVDEGTLDMAALQAEFDTYAADYEFGQRRAGTGGTAQPKDPVLRQAYAIVREMIRAKLKTQGRKATPEAINAIIPQVLEKSPEILEQARQEIESRKSISIDELEMPEGDANGEEEEEEASEGDEDSGEETAPEADTSTSRSRRRR